MLLVLSINSKAQTILVPEQNKKETTQQESVVFRKTGIPQEETSVVLRKSRPHSPHKATIMSMVLPGLGQVYNGQWWKVPIIYGGVAATIYGINWNISQYDNYKDAFVDYIGYLEQEVPEGGERVKVNDERWKKVFFQDVTTYDQSQEEWLKNALKNRKDSYKRDRDMLYIVMGGIYVLNIIDAVVFAHFYDFDISDDLSMGVRPTMDYTPMAGGSVGVSCTIRF